MSYLAKYRKSQFTRLSWEGYGRILDNLYQKVSRYLEENKIKIDAVVPILRGGAFPGGYLAARLHLLRILPVQYHYFFEGKKIILKKILGLPKNVSGLPRAPIFLLAENNHCFGLSAETAAKDLKEQFPGCRVIYAADTMDYSYQKNKYAEAIFYGELTNDARGLSEKQAKKVGLTFNMHLYPWENLKEEWTTVQGKQHRYKDIETVKKIAKAKVEIDNE